MRLSNLFAEAAKEKYRYPYKGLITTEQLWDLNETELNKVYIALSQSRNPDGGLIESADTEKDNELGRKMDIVKFIYDHKKKEEEEKKRAASNSIRRRELEDAIAAKRRDAVSKMSEEDLIAELEKLNAAED